MSRHPSVNAQIPVALLLLQQGLPPDNLYDPLMQCIRPPYSFARFMPAPKAHFLLSQPRRFGHNRAVQTRFLLGPAGSGKTHRCLEEIRAELASSPSGLPLILLAPKQATFQLERQLLARGGLAGYTRLQILSFDRLARFLLEALAAPAPDLLDEEGRVMVLRALLARHQRRLRLFHATARLPGFARQMHTVLRELQRHQVSPARLNSLADQPGCPTTLQGKLKDLALLARAWQEWLAAHQLQDADSLLDLAAHAARQSAPLMRFGGLWLDGFAEMTPQELDLLAVLAPSCRRATLAFCLESAPRDELSWLSTWSVVGQTFRQCLGRFRAIPDAEITIETLPRDPARSRFGANPFLARLEASWSSSAESVAPIADPGLAEPPEVVVCPNPEGEAVHAAREILRHVRARPENRFRDVAVLVRTLDSWHAVLQRVFTRYGIPHFIDRREPVAHHPLAELTRGALRVAALNWRREDWFGALKTGLTPASDDDIDRLENEALAGGWDGAFWRQIPGSAAAAARLSSPARALCERVLPPFIALGQAVAAPLTGAALADAVREFWRQLNVEQRLEEWSARQAALALSAPSVLGGVHISVWNQMGQWLENLALAFPDESMPLADWLPILEAGLSNLTVGVIPPALDQVLVGAIDRSRHPELELALVLGLNESAFPMPPAPGVILTDSDRAELEKHQITLGGGLRRRLGHERYFGYIACTRARQRLVLSCSAAQSNGLPLNPSPFLAHLRRILPALKERTFPAHPGWEDSEHVSELLAAVIQNRTASTGATAAAAPSGLLELPEIAPHLLRADQWAAARRATLLSPSVVEALYGSELRLSVSALEAYAACPFRFFIQRGLRGEEREEFDAGRPEEGGFLHSVLARFHQEVRAEGRQWRAVAPAEAAAWIRRIGEAALAEFQDGVFEADDLRRFRGRMLVESLARWMSVAQGWMPTYPFDPCEVELEFGQEQSVLPGWRVAVDTAHSLFLRGRIDRVDLHDAGPGQAHVVVMDYKSGGAQFDTATLHHGLELQLLAYLALLKHAQPQERLFEGRRLIPAGVFYVNLRGEFKGQSSRSEAFEDPETARRKAYQHPGRFNKEFAGILDSRPAPESPQFRFKTRDAMPAAEFDSLLESVKAHLRGFGTEIFAGAVRVDPCRKGENPACDRCDFAGICRFDPWTQAFRSLRVPPPAPSAGKAGCNGKASPGSS